MDTDLSASLAHVRLLTRVYSRVYRQCRALDELFPAPGPVASMRSNAGVDSLCNKSVGRPLSCQGITYRVAQGHCAGRTPCCMSSSERSLGVLHHHCPQLEEARAASEPRQHIPQGHRPYCAEWPRAAERSRRALRDPSPFPPAVDAEGMTQQCGLKRLAPTSLLENVDEIVGSACIVVVIVPLRQRRRRRSSSGSEWL